MKAEMKDLKTRTKEYALRIIRLYTALPQTVEAQVIGKQLLRSGTSVGAHYREGMRARSDAEFISNIKEIQRKIVLSETKSAYTFLEKTKNDYQIFISQNNLISTFLDYIEEIIKLIELDTNDGNLFLQKTQQNFPTKEYQLFDRKNLYSKNTKFYFNYKQSINDLLLILHVLNTMYLNLDLDKLLMLLSSEDLIYNDQYCSKHELLGKIYFKKHNINDAASQFLKALDCNENLFFPNYFLGDYYFFSKKEKSEKYLEKSIQLKNDCSECYLLLSKHYERKGDDNNRKKFTPQM